MDVDTGRRTSSPPVRVGSVSFLNAKPLIFGLEEAEGIELHLDVPSRLLCGLQEERFDVGLLPVIDYQRMPGLRLLTSGGIGSNGRTMTVRIFSPVPIERITTLACDTDSHTSVALARVILAERFGIRPEFVPLDGAPVDPGAARLLIGDKVVCEEPAGLVHQLDLGEAWKQQTGLPFVFAAWMAREGVPLGDLPARLEQAKREGRAQIESIIERFAIPRGWPAPIAREYLTERLQYDIGPEHLEAIRLFHRLAHRYGLIPESPRALDVVDSASRV
ncbi:MAG TPA: menaquinone biosynthesis protein [Tepidisphaeraceae bacterium]|jgi:chorismate dehydratase